MSTRSGPENRRLSFKIGDIGVSVSSDLPDLLDDFLAIYRECRVHAPAPDRTIDMEVRRMERRSFRSGRFRIFGDGEEYAANRQRNETFPYLEWGINQRIVETRPEYLQLHAASAARLGRGFIFAGGPGSGKSTLTAGLLARGWNYFCDEFALIHRDTLRLHAFPKALCIKAESFPVIKRLGLPFARRRDYVKGLKGRVGYINALEIGPHTVAEPCRARFIIFLRYTEGAKPHLHPISPARAVLGLMGCTFNRGTFGLRTPEILGDLVRNAECFELVAGEIEATCDLVESLVGGRAGRQGRRSEGLDKPPAHSPEVEAQRRPSRRDLLRHGARAAYVAPVVLTLTAQEALAGSTPSGMCSTAVQTGGLCETDTDCCSGDCDIGVCR